jgi:hypothetical protein
MKFKRGQTVKILSRLPDNTDWENSNVRGNGVIEFYDSNDFGDYVDTNLYGLVLLNCDGTFLRRCNYFEEKFLELYCSNEERGLKIIKDNPAGF